MARTRIDRPYTDADRKLTEALVRKWERLCLKLSAEYVCRYLSLEEGLSVCRQSLLQIHRAYRPALGEEVGYFAAYLRGRLRAAMRTERRAVTGQSPTDREGNPQFTSGDAPRGDDWCLFDLIGNSTERGLVARLTLDELMQGLTPRERDVVRWYELERRTFEAIGETLGVTKQRAKQIHQSAVHTLRDHAQELDGHRAGALGERK